MLPSQLTFRREVRVQKYGLAAPATTGFGLLAVDEK